MRGRYKVQGTRRLPDRRAGKTIYGKVIIAVFFLLAASYIQAQTITTGAVSSGLCAGSYISVAYTITGTFNTGNIFTAQLSDASGSFSSPVNIGLLPDTGSAAIDAYIPFNTAPGNAYRVRIISSNPAVTGSSNTTNISVAALSATRFQNNYSTSNTNSYYRGKVMQLSDGSFAALTFGFDLYKLDPLGNVLWARQIYEQHAGSAILEGLDLQQTFDGGFIIGAYEYYNDGGTDPTQNHIFLVKTDSSGTIEWSNSYGNNNTGGGGSGTQLTGVKQTSDSGYIITGVTNDFGFGSPGGKSLVLKVDKNGNVSWTKIFDAFDADYVWGWGAPDAQEIPDSAGDLMIWSYNYPSPNSYPSMGLLVRTHADGTVVWSEQINGLVNPVIVNMALTNGGFFLGLDQGMYLNSAILAGVIKVDFNGNIIWSKAFTGSNTLRNYLYSVAATTDGGCVISQGFMGSCGIVKLSSSGDVQWGENYSSGNMQFGVKVIQAKDGGYLLSGSQGSNGNVLCLVKTDTLGLAGGSENSTSPLYSTSDAGCTAAAYSPSFNSYTMSTYPSCAITSNFDVAVNSFTSSTNCTLDEQTLTTNACAPFNFTVNSSIICAGNTVNFRANANNTITSWDWLFPGGTPGASAAQNPYITYDTPGTYNVKLVVTYSSGGDSLVKTGYMTVLTTPVVDTPAARPDTVCTGGSTQLTANGSSGGVIQWQTSSSGNNFTDIGSANFPTYITPALSQNTYYRLYISNGNCTDTSSSILVVVISSSITPPVLTASDTSVCASGSVSLTVTGTYTGYQWQSSPGGNNFSNITGANSPDYSTPPLTQSAGYRVVVSEGLCTDTSTALLINVNTPVSPALICADSLICANDSALITASGSYVSYQWSDGDNRSFTYVSAAGGYWVSVTDANGCTAVSGHQQISVYPVPSVSVVQRGDTLSTFGAVNYQWYLNDTLIPGADSAVYIAKRPGAYSVEITDTNGCTETSSQLNVTSTGAGVQDINDGAYFNCYPNPFATSLVIQVTDPDMKIEQVKIYDVMGRIVLTKKINSMIATIKLDVSALPEGLYYVKMKANGTDYAKQIVKQ